MDTPSPSTFTPVDPNRPSQLSIVPSSRSTLQLRRPTRQEASSEDPSRTDGVDAEFDQDDEELEHEQDIDTYGIAGRTWEAAYLMKRYCKPPYASSSKLVFEPPCPLFVQPATTEDSSSPPPSQSTKQRKRNLVEIGSGTGYLSLHLLPFLKESDRLIVTDLPEVCPLLRTNLAISATNEEGQERRSNGKGKGPHVQTTLGDVKVRPLPWGDEEAFEKLKKEFDLFSSADDDSDTGPGPDLILASDLVYFPFLYPGLLRTLIWLTQPRKTTSRRYVDDTRKGNDVPQVLIGYKIRSLPREEPFWKAFGIWFEFEPVYYRPIATSAQNPNTTFPSPAADEEHWHRFGETSDGQDQLFIFVCTRRPKTYTWDAPKEDEALMNGLGSDDQFETLLLLGMEY